MPNARILHNIISDSATLTASTTSGGFIVTHLQNNRKGDIHRSTGTSVQYVAVLPIAKTMGICLLPICNLTSAATVRVRCYSDAGGTTLINDSGTVAAVAARVDQARTAPLGVAGFAYGSGEYAIVWLPEHISGVMRVVIDIGDFGNPQGYIECARLVLGDYYEFTYNPQYGATVLPIDKSLQTRSESGNQVIDRGIMTREISFDLSFIPADESKYLLQIFRTNGISFPFFISFFPNATDKRLEADHAIFGCFTSTSKIKLEMFNGNSTALTIEEF